MKETGIWDTIRANSELIREEIEWFTTVLDMRMKLYFEENPADDAVFKITPPDLPQSPSPFAEIIRAFKMTPAERMVLMLSFLPHIRPQALDIFLVKNKNFDRPFSEFGGVVGYSHGGFLPTGETAMFLIAGNSLELRFSFRHLFSREHFFYKANILRLTGVKPGEPLLSGALTLSEEYIERLTTGRPYRPPYTSTFPAKRIETRYEWEDLILDWTAIEQIREIMGWIEYGEALMNKGALRKRLKPGFRTLFYGPPGTGKTLTAGLIGKLTGLDVYRIDLSMMISKYIGETEKNLAALFDQAENKNWILFFDEADSLFTQRTETHTANDRSANQQVSYLLQRVEDFPGVVILATNMMSNIDEAFLRRFQSIIHFPMPDASSRLKLWEQCFQHRSIGLEPGIDFENIADHYEVTGGNMINILRYSCIQSAMRKGDRIKLQDIIGGIKKEFTKMGRTLEHL